METLKLNLVQRATLVLLAVGAFVVGLWPTWFVRDRVLAQFGNPPYEGVWILIPHALLYSTLAALFCAIVWFVLTRARWLAPPSFALNGGVVLWGIAGGVIALGITVGTLFATGQSGAFHAAEIDPWLMGGNLFSNFFEEFIFRGFILVALTAALGFWPAAILSSIAFGAVHTQYPIELQVLVGLMGFVWCLIAARTKSLLAPYISHMTLDWLIDPFL
jgi:membrane protease YdiL (CAAX protease family)